MARWLEGFAERHQVVRTVAGPEAVRFEGADGAVAEAEVPFPPLRDGLGEHAGLVSDALAEHALRDRVVGVLLVRAGAHAAGVFEGTRLVASKVGTRLVHGRHRAGGWSQQRFARRREGQAREALKAAAEDAVRVLEPHLGRLAAVVLGGDRRAVDALREEPRLRPVFTLAVARFLPVPEPRLAVLRSTPALFRAVRIRVTDPRAAGEAPE
ncbi:hypothetical protein LI90_1569 [Carbonactinospora thermoautotrophica]|uniref:Actinobacteria/chloroflexi VLRF1 release factor domain-containing protein n=1 Tax=Carbonactinospora thermoautotrophica TaxID=1469144 RepID=A0A132MQC7_9ACTN|nr:hypothetical protein LI90_1569 [Carbonactinospora thermoautotrophica]